MFLHNLREQHHLVMNACEMHPKHSCLFFEKNDASFSDVKDETLLEIKVLKAEVLLTNDILNSRRSQDTSKTSEGI